MSKNYKLRSGVRLALGLSSGLAMLAGSAAFAADDDESAESMEEVVVTGSRIKRTMNTASQETLVITAEDLEISGDVSVAEALRSSNLNSLGSFRESSGSSAQSNATINLRGVGSSRSLILINGRRMTGSPSLGGGGSVNLNMIPFSALDRIEVVADGGSAVYGSDAVAGVVNIILKKNYDGFRLKARYGDRERDFGNEESFSILTGASSDRGSITFALEYDSRDEIYDADREFTKARKSDLNGNGQIDGYQETEGISVYGYTLINPGYTGGAVDPNDSSTWFFHPGDNCTEEDGFQGVMSYYNYGYYCGYAYALVSANRASLKRVNSWISAEYELTDDVDAFVDVVISDNQSFGRYAPPAAGGPVIPGDPRNTIGATYGYFRWTDIGTRDNVVNDTLIDINIGLKGDLSDDFSFEVTASNSEYTTASIGAYYLSYAGLAYNVAYGVNDFDTFVANLKTTTLQDESQSVTRFFAGLQWDMFDMAGGTASSYFAAEYYEVDYAALVDAQSEAGLVGGSAGNSAEGYRDVKAFTVEAILPVADWLEIDAAIRVDEYSDFGNATSPRIGAVMNVPGFEQVTLKASWGQGFRAPDLSDMYGLTTFSAEGATDYWGCQQNGVDPCPTEQFSTYIGSNPDLGAEESETFSFGVDYEFIDNWVVGINYFNLKIDNAIEYTSAQDQLNVDYQTSGGNSAVTRNSAGKVEEISAGYQNGFTEFEYNGVDYALRGTLDTSFGVFQFSFDASQYLEYSYEVTYGTGELGDGVGDLGFPEWRSNAYVAWSMDKWSASVAMDFIGESKERNGDEKYDSWEQLNASVSYDLDGYGRIKVGATNITDEDPLLNAAGSMAEPYQYPLTGRVVYAEYTLEF